MDFEHALRSHGTSIWKTLTSGGWQRAWRSLPWKSSTHFIKWPWSNTCLSINNALLHEKGKRRHKGSYSWDRTPLQHISWKMTYFLKRSRNIIRQWVTIQVVNDKYIIFCSHTRYPQSLSQLRHKTHSTNHHHTLGCGRSRTPACLLMGTAMRGGEARKSPCQPHALLLVLITKQKRLRMDGRRVVSAEAATHATQQRAPIESGWSMLLSLRAITRGMPGTESLITAM